MILINEFYHKSDFPRELDLEIDYSMKKSMSLGIFVHNKEDYYELMTLLKEKGFFWQNGTSPPNEPWDVSTSIHSVPLLIILRNYRITRSSYKLNSEWELDAMFDFSDFH